MIANRSGFLETARSSRWNKDPEVPVDLSDADPQDFSDYLQLVYTSELAPFDPTISQYRSNGSLIKGNASTRSVLDAYFHMLARLYVLADELEDLISANKIMDRLLDFNHTLQVLPPPPTITWLYENTPSNIPLRRMMRDLYIYESGNSYFDGKGEAELPYELLIEMIREHRKLRKENNGKQIQKVYPNRIAHKFSKCHYHQHKDGDPQCK
jgi:hypothetical protein